MHNDKRLKEIQSDIQAIKMQLEALVCETRLSKMETLSYLLQLAYEEASLSPDKNAARTTVNGLPPTLQ